MARFIGSMPNVSEIIMELDCTEFPAIVCCPFCKTCLYALNPESDYRHVQLCRHVAFIDDGFFDEFVGKETSKVYEIKVWTGGSTQTTIGFKNSQIPFKWKPKEGDFQESSEEQMDEDSYEEPTWGSSFGESDNSEEESEW